jgi:endonuclease YncB( thermonuclease family)
VDRVDERAVVDRVHDGDTLRLTDRRNVRLIGINTPELGTDVRPAEPLADAAAAALRALVPPGSEIRLRYDAEREDRHGRVLAHVYTPAGASAAAALLEQGLGSVVSIPPNLWGDDCYLAAERGARQARRGVWQLPDYVTDAAHIGPDASGYRVLTGTVRHVTRTPRSVKLAIGANVVVTIAADDRRYFGDRAFADAPVYWHGRQVEARGWLHRHNGRLYLRVRHTSALTIVQ